MSSKGVELEKTLALRFAPNTVHTHGSLCVAFPHHEKDMEADYHVCVDCVAFHSNRASQTYRKFGINVELFNAEKVAKFHGKEAGFTRGLFFPDDAIIHSAEYSRGTRHTSYCTCRATFRTLTVRSLYRSA